MPVSLTQVEEHLIAVPFVHRVKLERSNNVVTWETPAGKRLRPLSVVSSNVGPRLAAQLAARLDAGTLIVAPFIGPRAVRVLRSAGIDSADLVGNIDLNLEDQLVASYTGRRAPKTATSPSMRGAAWRVLFAYLVTPSLMHQSLRVTARAAGTSPGAVRALRQRLLQDGSAVQTRTGLQLVDAGETVDRWTRGYADTLRASLHLGTYRLPGSGMLGAYRSLEALFGACAIGGREGAHMLDGPTASSGGGPPSVLHIPVAKSADAGAVPFDPEPTGDLQILGIPAPAAMEFSIDAIPRVVHPLVTYAELHVERRARDLEVAADLRTRFGQGWGTP